jgi:hypothetical protein
MHELILVYQPIVGDESNSSILNTTRSSSCFRPGYDQGQISIQFINLVPVERKLKHTFCFSNFSKTPKSKTPVPAGFRARSFLYSLSISGRGFKKLDESLEVLKVEVVPFLPVCLL